VAKPEQQRIPTGLIYERRRTNHQSAALAPTSKKMCKKDIGKEVRVLIHKTKPERSRINSFFQFWMMPSIYFLISALFSGLSSKGGVERRLSSPQRPFQYFKRLQSL